MRVDEAPIASPCDEDLDRMRLDPGGLQRHCDRCSKAVHDLSALGPERARALLAGTRGSICISYTADGGGELVFDSPRTRAPARPDFVPLARLAQAATLVVSLSACTPHGAEAPMQIHESAAVVEAIEASPPVVIPTQPTPPAKPPAPAIEEPCEPEVVREKLYPIKGELKRRGVYISDHGDPL